MKTREREYKGKKMANEHEGGKGKRKKATIKEKDNKTTRKGYDSNSSMMTMVDPIML